MLIGFTPPNSNGDKFMIKFLFAVAMLSVVPLAQAEVSNCKELWSKEIPDTRYYNLNCKLHLKKNIGEAALEIYHYTDSWTNSANELALLGEMEQAFEDTHAKIGYYTGFPSITFMLVDKEAGFEGTDAIAYPKKATTGGGCPVFIYQNFLKMMHPQERKQVLAHEMIHCYQNMRFPGQMEGDYPLLKWWAEGTAVYLSNFIYPDVYVDRAAISGYKPSIPLHLHNFAYATASFFHSIAEGANGDIQIFGFMDMMPTGKTSSDAQAQAMVKDARTIMRFHKFAEQFTTNTIKDVSGKVLETKYPGVTVGELIERKTRTYERKLESFTFDTVAYTFQKGGKYTMRIPMEYSEETITVSYRKQGTQAWELFNPYGPLVVDTSCTGKQVDYEFLFSSVGAHGKMQEIEIEVDYEKLDCPCADKVEFDQCLVGNWKLQTDSIDSMFRKIYSNIDGLTYLGLKGESYLNVASGKKGTVNIPGMTVSVRKDEVMTGRSFNMDVKIDGSVGASIGLPEKNKICFTNLNGTFNNTTTLSAPDMPSSDSVTVIDLSSEAAQVSSYSCSGNTFIIKFPLPLSTGMEVIEFIYKK